jgi:hypothetical protein
MKKAGLVEPAFWYHGPIPSEVMQSLLMLEQARPPRATQSLVGAFRQGKEATCLTGEVYIQLASRYYGIR